jgi:hypothetical protein
MGTYYDVGATDGHSWCEGDLDYDGYVGLSDAVILGTYYPQDGEVGHLVSEMSGLGAVPEPATLSLLALGGLALLRRRRAASS